MHDVRHAEGGVVGIFSYVFGLFSAVNAALRPVCCCFTSEKNYHKAGGGATFFVVVFSLSCAHRVKSRLGMFCMYFGPSAPNSALCGGHRGLPIILTCF